MTIINIYQKQNIKKILVFFCVFLFITIFTFVYKVYALELQTDLIPRSYIYPSIEFNFKVNKDSTVDVIENETFNFVGEYNLGWRSLNLNKLDDITDISIIDGVTGISLRYTSERQDKMDPNSWGSYTVFRENNSKNIEWYFNHKDTTYNWILTYKLHGAIGFYKNHDELYYNLITDFTAPISYISATITLPSDIAPGSPFSFYRTSIQESVINEQINENTFFFQTNNVLSGEKLTIAPGWQKGIIDYKAYRLWYIKTHWGLISGIILLLLSLIFDFIYWYWMEKKPMKKMTIIAQYEPPENLPPAMAEIIIKEKITKKALPATIIDLACRGYLNIKEDHLSVIQRMKNSGVFFSLLIMITFLLSFLVAFRFINLFLGVIIIITIIIIIVIKYLIEPMPKNEYILYKIEKDTSGLKEYEKEYLKLLFELKNIFSTLEERKISSKDREYGMKKLARINKIKNCLYKEMNFITKSFAVKPIWDRVNFLYIAIMIIVYGLSISSDIGQIIFLIIGVILSGLKVFLRLNNPRLNEKGRVLKAEWLGFKLYLNTAERYRLQNLTPDMFEKYLPYAMIFGVEKKWAKAFDGMNVSSPVWYSSSSHGRLSAMQPGISSSFSAFAFSSSFGSSFSSSFSRGGGGSGGGGRAGGGGGGGGGGAS
jgi:uncharacterized membrane protein